jgi:single-stranded-DNA-specific exonuclease
LPDIPVIRWNYEPPPATAAALAQALGLSELLAGLLARRGIADAAAAEAFLRPRLADLGDPFQLDGVEAAARLLDEALAANRRIVVFGDYDVDGVTSTALLVNFLRTFGAQPRFALPRRLEEGYGLSRAVLERVFSEGAPELFICLDSGTSAVEEVAWLRARACAVIIVDHHRSKSALPQDCVMINPHIGGAPAAPWSQLCTVGLVFKLLHGFLKLRRAAGDARAFEVKLAEALDLVALGTVADLVPLEGENRILARHGLRVLEKCERHGLRALFAVSGLEPGQSLATSDVSYRLGPRINASGRLADAALPVELLLGTDPQACAKAAATLESLNRERQGIERQVQAEAERMVEATQRDAAALVVFGEQWHPGVVGIVAGKLSRQYGRPCIVLGREGAQAKGSGRSVPGINLVEVLQSCAALLSVWGGHPMAVGVTLETANIAAFHMAFAAAVQARRENPAMMEAACALELSAWIGPEEIGEELLTDLDLLHPYGESNAEPVFGVRRVRLAQPPEVFKEVNYRCRVPTGRGRGVSAVAWRKASRLPPAGAEIDLAAKLQWNNWNGRKYPQLEILDWRAAE